MALKPIKTEGSWLAYDQITLPDLLLKRMKVLCAISSLMILAYAAPKGGGLSFYSDGELAKMEANCNSNADQGECNEGAPYCKWSINEFEAKCIMDTDGTATETRMSDRCSSQSEEESCLKVGIWCEFDQGKCEQDRFIWLAKKKARVICDLIGVGNDATQIDTCVEAYEDYCQFRNGTRDC